MNREDELLREIEALRERLSRLSAASLSINESLDFDAVLHGVLDSARALTGAGYGVLVLLDEAGRLQELLRAGIVPPEGRPLWDYPEQVRFFEYVGNAVAPLRLRDFHAHARGPGHGRVSAGHDGQFPAVLPGRAHPPSR